MVLESLGPRVAGTIKMPSPAPVASTTSTRSVGGTTGGVAANVSQRASRLSQQVHPRQSPSRSTRRVTASVGPDLDEDAEGEDEPEDTAEDLGEVEEDKEIYCFCRKLSYGEVRTSLVLFVFCHPRPMPVFGCVPFFLFFRDWVAL